MDGDGLRNGVFCEWDFIGGTSDLGLDDGGGELEQVEEWILGIDKVNPQVFIWKLAAFLQQTK